MGFNYNEDSIKSDKCEKGGNINIEAGTKQFE